MKIDNKYKLPCNIFQLKVIDTLDFDGEFILTAEEDAMKTKYLSYLIGNEGVLERIRAYRAGIRGASLSYLIGNEGFLEQRAVIAISDEHFRSKLEAVASGETSIYDAYNNAENGVVFICEYAHEEKIVATYAMSCEEFMSLGLISRDYKIPIYDMDGRKA